MPVRLAEHAIELGADLERLLGDRALRGDLREDAALEQLPHRGHADHRGDARLLEARGDAIAVELVEVHDARAARERQEHAARELERVVERQHAEHAVAAR